jgi:DNA-binding NarL/FixJ family response regulator
MNLGIDAHTFGDSLRLDPRRGIGHPTYAAAGPGPTLATVDRIAAGRLIAAAPSADAVSPLSVRELQVARLVATGATNREIASALSIAPKTASAHIEHILR